MSDTFEERTAEEHTADPETLYAVDTSAWRRGPQFPAVQNALRAKERQGQLCLVPTTVLEMGYSAQSGKEWDRLMGFIAGFAELPLRPQTREAAVRLQGLLWHKGLVRSVGVFDVMTAAVALDHGAIILHYDRDFEILASVCPELRHEWILPAGSVD